MYTKALAALAAFLVTSSATPIPRQAAPNKRGICYNDPASLAKFGGAISWALDWASTPLGDLGNVQFVPVLKPGQEGTWDTDIGNAAYLLGPNEPDQPIEVGGTATSASVVAAYYFEGGAMAKHQGQAKIGGPAISSGGIQWLRDFSAACAGNCKIDFIPLHFYNDNPDPSYQVTSLKGWLGSTIDEIKTTLFPGVQEIWLTEFGYKPDSDQAGHTAFMNEALPWLDSDESGISRYAYFKSENLIDSAATYASGASGVAPASTSGNNQQKVETKQGSVNVPSTTSENPTPENAPVVTVTQVTVQTQAPPPVNNWGQ